MLTVKAVIEAGSGEPGTETDQVFADSETTLFSRVVSLAEKAGSMSNCSPYRLRPMECDGADRRTGVLQCSRSTVSLNWFAEAAKADARKIFDGMVERDPVRGPEWFEELIDCLYSLEQLPYTGARSPVER